MDDQNHPPIKRKKHTIKSENEKQNEDRNDHSTSKYNQLSHQPIQCTDQMINSQINQQLNKETNQLMNQSINRHITQQADQEQANQYSNISIEKINQLISRQQSNCNALVPIVFNDDDGSLNYLKELDYNQIMNLEQIDTANSQMTSSNLLNLTSDYSLSKVHLPSFCTLIKCCSVGYSSPNFILSSNNQETNPSTSCTSVHSQTCNHMTCNSLNLQTTNYGYLQNPASDIYFDDQEKIISSVGNQLNCRSNSLYCCTYSISGTCTCTSEVCLMTCCCQTANNETIDPLNISCKQINKNSCDSQNEISTIDYNRKKITTAVNLNSSANFIDQTEQNSDLNHSYSFSDFLTSQTCLKERPFDFAIPKVSNCDYVTNCDQADLQDNHMNPKTIELISKRIKSQSGKIQCKKNPLVIEDTMGLNLDEFSTYAKISNIFYHLNLKLGNSPSNQLFELGVFFGVMINRYPDIRETEGSGADNLRKVFIDTRKHFKDILKRQGKLTDEDEVKSVKSSGTDLMDQLNLSSNSASSLFSNITNISNQQKFTIFNQKRT